MRNGHMVKIETITQLKINTFVQKRLYKTNLISQIFMGRVPLLIGRSHILSLPLVIIHLLQFLSMQV